RFVTRHTSLAYRENDTNYLILLMKICSRRYLSEIMNPSLIIVPLLYAVITAAQAAEPVPLESLAAPLLKARTYCESGKWGVSFPPNPSFSEFHYRVCAQSDGRFKYVENPGRPG